jgi:transcriptional regulator with XRE-family HTH domain
LAERLGVSVKYVQRIERGLENMTLETLGKLTRALEVATAELFVARTVIAPRVMKHVVAERDSRRRVRAILLRSDNAAFADVRIPIVADAAEPPLRVVGVHVDTLGLAAPRSARP